MKFFSIVVAIFVSVNAFSQTNKVDSRLKKDQGTETYRYYTQIVVNSYQDLDLSTYAVDTSKAQMRSLGLSIRLGKNLRFPNTLSFDYGLEYGYWQPYAGIEIHNQTLYVSSYYPYSSKFQPFLGMNLARTNGGDNVFSPAIGYQLGARLLGLEIEYRVRNSDSTSSGSNRGISYSDLNIRSTYYF